MEKQIKFKRVTAGEYEAKYKGYLVEISKNYESLTWSVSIWTCSASLFASQCLETYSDCKEWAKDVLTMDILKNL